MTFRTGSTTRKRRERAVCQSARGGFTLVEILFVIAVLAVLAGVVWPAVLRYVGEMRLREGADEARMNIAATRMRAMEAGEAYRWFCQPGGRWYAALAESAETATTQTTDAGTGASRPMWRWLAELPEGVVFDSASLTSATPQVLPPTLLSGLPGAERINDTVTWVEVLRFQMDGSSRGAKLVAIDTANRKITIDVRGLTGTATLGQVEVQRGP